MQRFVKDALNNCNLHAFLQDTHKQNGGSNRNGEQGMWETKEEWMKETERKNERMKMMA